MEVGTEGAVVFGGVVVTATGVHCACTTTLPSEGENDEPNFVPPDSSVNQPSNVKPARVGAAGRVTEPPETKVESETVVPPCSSNVTVNGLDGF